MCGLFCISAAVGESSDCGACLHLCRKLMCSLFCISAAVGESSDCGGDGGAGQGGGVAA